VTWPYTKEKKVKLFDPECLYEGETVAAVAAETPYQAWDAVRAIKVDYEVLPFVVDERKALDPQAPPVQPEGNRVRPVEIYERGDLAKGFAQADLVLEQTYRTECELHTPMELHGCVARWERNLLTIWESTQGVYPVQARVAEVLGLPLSKVRVIGHYMGGGFGSKLQADKYTIIAALLAKKTGRPVKLFLTREETYLAVGNRPPSNMKLKAGMKKDGTLTAMHFTCTGTGGAFAAGGTGLVDWLIKELYLCPNVRTELADVYINAGLSRPFRAPGHPQGAWALEQMLDALAEAIGMDPVELRLKNIPTFRQTRNGNPPYTTTGLRECLEEGAKAFGWEKARREIAQNCGGENTGRGNGPARVPPGRDFSRGKSGEHQRHPGLAGHRRAGRGLKDRGLDHDYGSGRKSAGQEAVSRLGPGGGRGGQPPVAPSGYPRWEPLPEAPLLVLPRRIPLPPERRGDLLRF
ncbi:MAG: xanthine dehydrogenase family protein, partial [Deltaproteobacteria bacterium]|nr:xanthine dehydrogenase family protein [Deltaproteobacteria bacterium]